MKPVSTSRYRDGQLLRFRHDLLPVSHPIRPVALAIPEAVQFPTTSQGGLLSDPDSHWHNSTILNICEHFFCNQTSYIYISFWRWKADDIPDWGMNIMATQEWDQVGMVKSWRNYSSEREISSEKISLVESILICWHLMGTRDFFAGL